MIFLYFFIGLLASWIGSMAGLGGGVIIKPVLDFFGHYSLETIGILIKDTVLAMSTVSLIRVRGMAGLAIQRYMDGNVDIWLDSAIFYSDTSISG